MKLHIEADAFAGNTFNDFKDEIGDRARAIGILVCLWQETQSHALVAGNRERIESCLSVPRSQRGKVFEALLLSGYVKASEGGLYEIRGNRKHVEALREYKERGSRGGKKSAEIRAEKAREKGADQASKTQAPATKIPSQTKHKLEKIQPSQFLSVPISSSQISKDQEKEEELKPSGESDKPTPRQQTEINKRCWDAYEAAYLRRHKVRPTRNKTVNCQMANFVRRVGGADAPGIAVFYVAHNDFLYLRSKHPVSLMLRDAEGLRTQWLQGRPTTSNDARELEKSDRLRSQLARIDSGELDLGGE